MTVDDDRRLTARGERRLEAPHRRMRRHPRIAERIVVASYRGAGWLLSVLPEGFASAVMGRLAQTSYLVWSKKRRWSNRNFGHVLGLDPDHPDVRRLALRAYRLYGRYLVELMRLPSRPDHEVERLVPDLDEETLRRVWHDIRGDGGLILAAAHIGHNEAVAASIARHGMPISVVADDSSFPELFALLSSQRESWGVHVIPWRNLREIYEVLRRQEILALLIDWGYRRDGIPVRLFGAWTALPAGPAMLAARTGSRILPLLIHRRDDGTFDVSWSEPIDVASSDSAELQRATQALADALAEAIRPAPEQWYSFKPIWPATDEEAAELERRAGRMQAGLLDRGAA